MSDIELIIQANQDLKAKLKQKDELIESYKNEINLYVLQLHKYKLKSRNINFWENAIYFVFVSLISFVFGQNFR